MQARQALEHQAEAAGRREGAGQGAREPADQAQAAGDDEGRRDKARQDEVFGQRRPGPAQPPRDIDGARGQPQIDGEQHGLGGGDAGRGAQQDQALDRVALDLGIEIPQVFDQFVEIGAETAQQRLERGFKTMVEIGQRGDAQPGGDHRQAHHHREQRAGAEILRHRPRGAVLDGETLAGQGAGDQRRGAEAEQEDQAEQRLRQMGEQEGADERAGQGGGRGKADRADQQGQRRKIGERHLEAGASGRSGEEQGAGEAGAEPDRAVGPIGRRMVVIHFFAVPLSERLEADQSPSQPKNRRAKFSRVGVILSDHAIR